MVGQVRLTSVVGIETFKRNGFHLSFRFWQGRGRRSPHTHEPSKISFSPAWLGSVGLNVNKYILELWIYWPNASSSFFLFSIKSIWICTCLLDVRGSPWVVVWLILPTGTRYRWAQQTSRFQVGSLGRVWKVCLLLFLLLWCLEIYICDGF